MKNDAFSKCHPAVCFLYFLGAIGFGVVIQHPAYLLSGMVGAAAYLLLLRGSRGWKQILAMAGLFLFVSIINPLFNIYGRTLLFDLFGRPYTLEALYHGMAVAGMLVVMLLWFGCYNQVLTGDKFTSLFGSLIPALSLLIVMVLRLIPSFIRKAKQIAGARKSIGKGAGPSDTTSEKLSHGTRILSALTDWALEGSLVTADSMRARGYGTAKRTSFQLYKMTRLDWVLLGLILLLAACVILAGGTNASYTPEVAVAPLSWGFVAYCAYLLIPTALGIWEATVWHISRSKIESRG